MKDHDDSETFFQETETKSGDYELLINLQKHRIVIHNRYEWIHIINDGMQAMWFLIGSIFFFYSSLETLAIWLFVIGSAQMAIRPIIRISHKLHRQEIETQIKNKAEKK